MLIEPVHHPHEEPPLPNRTYNTTSPISSPTHQLQVHIANHYKYIQSSSTNIASTIQVLPITTSSSFEIPSPTHSDPLSTSLTPEVPSLVSPHDPPYDADLYCPQRASIRPRGTTSLFGRDIFDEYVGHRYDRFRPTESQQNNDVIMNNMHPFQRDDYGVVPKSFLESVASWFKPRPVVHDLEMQQQREEEEEKSESLPNTVIITREAGESSPHPVYTPRGIPINEFVLNYSKPVDDSNLGEETERRAAIVNSFDEEVRDLVDGSDNFLTSCFDGIWTFFNDSFDYCLNLS
ncbi:hypothetical protein CANMA_003123 [Candida margitis]|uniref:uncharacterized protein n=1 Tax=Candida margitis TaxID=1775924 RepID=UPI002227FE38|nr:uncharacterized protein CANMA_003123 [Candida margitis]KAI5967303.1 hypothetical protein CANMA_003123 [Candida margitis]